jgi:hypothetical protein
MNQLTKKKIAALLNQRRRLLNHLAELPLLLHGSCFERFSTCARPNCPCHDGQKHGPRSYLVVYRDKTQHQVYLPLSQIKAARRGIAHYQRLLKIVAQLTTLNVQLLRGEVLADQEPEEK